MANAAHQSLNNSRIFGDGIKGINKMNNDNLNGAYDKNKFSPLPAQASGGNDKNSFGFKRESNNNQLTKTGEEAILGLGASSNKIGAVLNQNHI